MQVLDMSKAVNHLAGDLSIAPGDLIELRRGRLLILRSELLRVNATNNSKEHIVYPALDLKSRSNQEPVISETYRNDFSTAGRHLYHQLDFYMVGEFPRPKGLSNDQVLDSLEKELATQGLILTHPSIIGRSEPRTVLRRAVYPCKN